MGVNPSFIIMLLAAFTVLVLMVASIIIVGTAGHALLQLLSMTI
jgi:hypothetical protein